MAQLREHDEVIEVPVQHARQLQLRQMRHLGTQRARVELQLSGDARQVDQRRPLQRELKALAQRWHVGVQAMVRSNHREAREPAFGGLGLQQHRHAR